MFIVCNASMESRSPVSFPKFLFLFSKSFALFQFYLLCQLTQFPFTFLGHRVDEIYFLHYSSFGVWYFTMTQ